MAVGLRLGLDICEPHSCRCGLVVDARGLHSLVCKQASERSSRHHMLNDFVARALAAAGVPAVKEPAGLVRQDGKRPDGLTLIPYANGRSLTWDVAVCLTADSYIDLAIQGPGSVAEMAASRKEAKYACCVADSSHFPADRSGNTGPINESARAFLDDLGRRISVLSGDYREHLFLLPFSVLTPHYCTTVFPLGTTRSSFSTSNPFYFS